MAKRMRKSWLAVPVMALLSLMLLGFVVPTAGAQTSTTTTAKDNPDDLIKGLANQRYFVAASVKANSNFMNLNKDIESQLQSTVNKYKGKDLYIAVISNSSFPSNAGNIDSYSAQIFNFLNNPKPQVLVVVNAQGQNLKVTAPKLSQDEINTIQKDAVSAAVAKNVTAGAVTAGTNAAEKISSNESGSFITTLIIVLVVLVVIVGAVSFLLINTKRNWKQRVSGLENLANQVSDQVVKVSDDINFLPDAARERTNAQFGVATQNFSEANTRLRELQGASPVALLLKGPEYERKLNLTGAQFEQVRQALGQVAQETQRALPPS